MIEKPCSKCGEVKPASAFNRAAANKLHGLQAYCRDCAGAFRRKWNKENAERKNAYQRERYDRETSLKYHKRWRKKNPEAAKASINRSAARRREALVTPAWANEKKIERIYMLAAWASKFTDEPLQVDHIIPIQNKAVCGLHVENNLQILKKSENIRKKNKFFPDLFQ